MRLCLGTVQFGINYGIQGNGQPQEEKVFEMLSFAISNGIDVLDTASAYGDAERILGDYFRAYPEKMRNVRIVSKLRPDAFANESEEKWADIAAENARQSLERIGAKRFFAYLFHNAAHIFNGKAVEALNRVREEGLAERIGVSVYTPEEAMKALEYPSIGAIQIPYNLFDHRLDKCGFFQKAKKQGVTVFARSSLLQGLLMMHPDELPDRVAFAGPYLRRFHELCAKYNISPLNAAVGYVGEKSEIDYVVFGIDNISQLKEYISIQNQGLSEDFVSEVCGAFENAEEKLVNPVLWK